MTKEIYTGYNIENLQKLRDAVERHRPEHFDMGMWFRENVEGRWAEVEE